MATMLSKAGGRKAGGKNRGYWYNKAKGGWYLSNGGRLVDGEGNWLRDAKTPDRILRAAYKAMPEPEARPTGPTLAEVCEAYLAHLEANRSAKTFFMRADYLFDLCTGLPAGFRKKGPNGSAQKGWREPTEKDRLHKGLGTARVASLTPTDIDLWAKAHPNWELGREALQAVKGALNYGVQKRLIPANPIRGYKVAKSKTHLTYFSPEQEELLCQNSRADFAQALKVLIRTGMRPACEFASLQAKQIQQTARGLVAVWDKGSKVRGKVRKVLIAPELEPIFRDAMAKHPTGPIFRTKQGEVFTKDSLKQRFSRLMRKLEAQGHDFRDGNLKAPTIYTARHTFAKRTLGGYWTGTPTTIENVAGLMGNTRQVCWDCYGQWCDAYTDPLWDALSGKAK